MQSQLFEQFQQTGKDLLRLGLTTSHGGNLSMRHQGRVLITAHFATLGRLDPGDILDIPLREEPGRIAGGASRDAPLHQLIYKYTPAMAIVHAHPAVAVALSLERDLIAPRDLEGSELLREIPVIPAAEASGSLPQVLQMRVALVVRGHGSYAVGRTLGEALAYTSALEFSCRVAHLAT